MSDEQSNKIFAGVLAILLAIYTSITIILIINNMLLVPVSGSSMQPTFGSGCNMSLSQEYTTQSISEDDIITFEYESEDGETKLIKHRVVDKIHSFSNSNPTYSLQNDTFIYNYSEDTQIAISPSAKQQDINTLEGETVYITKGDNNTLIDTVFVTQSKIKYTHQSFINTPDQLSPYICSE